MSRKIVWAGIPLLLSLAPGVSSATGYGRYGAYELSVVVDGERVPEHRLGDRTYIEAIRGVLKSIA